MQDLKKAETTSCCETPDDNSTLKWGVSSLTRALYFSDCDVKLLGIIYVVKTHCKH